MKVFAATIGLFVCMSVLAMPLSLQAQPNTTSGLVSCTGVDCTFCDVIKTANNLINLFFQLMVIAAVILIVIAGFRLVTSGGDVSAMTQAKSMLTNVIIGFVIVLSAWLIVDTVIKMLVPTGSSFGMWNEIDDAACGGLKNKDTLKSVGQPAAQPTGQ